MRCFTIKCVLLMTVGATMVNGYVQANRNVMRINSASATSASTSSSRITDGSITTFRRETKTTLRSHDPRYNNRDMNTAPTAKQEESKDKITPQMKMPSSRKEFFQKAAGSLAVASFGLTGIAQPSNAAANILPTIGIPAPSFTLPNSLGKGEKTSLSDLTSKNKWTVLYFYPASFTSGCTLEARGFQRDFNQYIALNSQIVGVSVDNVEKNAQFCQEEQLGYYMLSDLGGNVSKLYGTALSVPGFGTFSNRQTYVIDPKGELKWVFTDVESHVGRHSREVLDKLKELQE
uniref:thioredoxin-dependent peroxiredoxin n=1 Tax=Chaetoceros debilis TaxID=122233 RepID=A0A7S3PX84_9STRA